MEVQWQPQAMEHRSCRSNESNRGRSRADPGVGIGKGPAFEPAPTAAKKFAYYAAAAASTKIYGSFLAKSTPFLMLLL